MGLHDDYMKHIWAMKEYKQYEAGEIPEVDNKFYEEFKSKYKYNFKLNDTYIKQIKDALPKEYRPSQSRIEEQLKVSEKLHEVIFSTHYNYAFGSKFGRIYETFSNTPPTRSKQAFIGYLSEYATDENRTKLNEISQKIFDCQMEAKNAEAGKKPDAIDAAKEALFDAREEMDKFVKGIMVDELRRAAKEAPRVDDLMAKSNTPEKILENYREIRLRLMFMAESDNFLKTCKNVLDENEISEMREVFGKVHAKGKEFLNRAGFMANPTLAGNFDMEEVKLLSSKKLDKISFVLDKWDIFDPYKSEVKSDEEFEQREREIKAESGIVSGFTEMKAEVFNEWSADIRSYFGTGEGKVKIMDLEGDIRDLTVDELDDLYKDGCPFWAMNTASNRAEAVLCMPTEGHHLAVGKEAIDKIDTGKLEFNMKRPSSALFALDSFISFFNSNWRVKEVKKYKDELAIHEKRVALREFGEKTKKMVRDPRFKPDAIAFAHKVIMEETKESLKVEEANIAQEASKAGKTVEEYVKNYGKFQEEKLAKLEEEKRTLKETEDISTERNQLIGKLKSTEMPKHNVRRIRLALEKADEAVLNEVGNKRVNWVKRAASLMVRNQIKAELETILSGNKTVDKLPSTLTNVCKDNRPTYSVENKIKDLAKNDLFKNYVEGLSEDKKKEYFASASVKSQSENFSKFVTEFRKYTIDERKDAVIEKYELKAGKHREPKTPDIKPKDLDIKGVKPTDIL